MVKEVKRMSLKFEITEGRRIVLGLDSTLFSALISRVYRKVYAGSRYIFTLAHDLFHWLMPELYLLEDGLPSICSLLGWFDPYAAEMSQSGNRVRAVVFSEKLRIRFLCLTERAKASLDVFRKVSPRHQDRDSGDAVTDNDNLMKERKAYIAAVAADCATFIYRLSLNTRRSSNAGRRYLGPLRRLNDPLLQ